jgi:hypothetical protein
MQLTNDERYALQVAIDALQEDLDSLPHELFSWQERDRASRQLQALMERAEEAASSG